MRIADFLKNRFGVVVGVVLFLFACSLAQNGVLSISVNGNAPHLTDRVLQIAQECGVRKYSFFSVVDKPLLLSKITAIDGVEFCSLSRKGWAYIIEVRVGKNDAGGAYKGSLRAEKVGKIVDITCLCGTVEKSVGESVAVGDVVIANYTLLPNGQKQTCLVAGCVKIEVQANITQFYSENTPQNQSLALSSTAMYSDSVLQRSLKITPTDGGYYYNVNFTYLHTQACNID